MSAAAPTSDRLRRFRLARRRVRRAVLRRRRLLAAVLVAVGVVAALHAVTAPPAPTVPVPVAVRDLPSGAEVGPDDLATARFAAGTEPAGVVADPVGLTLAAPLRAGEPVTDVRVLGPGPTAGLDGVVATPLRLPDAGMAALLEVGDRIDLVATDPRDGTAAGVAWDVPVLALPAPDDDGAGTGASTGAAGLAGRLVVLGLDATEVAAVTSSAVGSFVTFTWTGR